ncbi:MAG: tail fiber domain-containing protein [Panacibacter sp.]
MKKILILSAGMFAVAGLATAQNTFPASGNVGIGTLTPAASLQTIGTTRLGSAANYAAVDANGNLTFAGTSAYRVQGNQYCFQYAANNNYGIYFNSTNVSIDYKTGASTNVWSVGVTTGYATLTGKMGIGVTPTNAATSKKLEVRSGDIRVSLPSTTTDSNTVIEFVNSKAGVLDWKFEHYTNPAFDPGSLYVEYANDDFANDANLNIAAYWDSGYNDGVNDYGIRYWVLGTMYADGYYQASDSKLKKDIKEMPSGLSIINQLKPKTYLYDTKKYNALGLREKMQYGFLAQDLEQVMPQSVTTQKALVSMNQGKRTYEEIKVVETMSLIPILTKAVQEQQAQIEELKALVEKLSQSVAASSTQDDAVASVTLTKASLSQNIPNPLNGNTSIRYNVPTGSTSAQLVITDNSGKTVKQMQLVKGAGNINIDASALTSGTYNYSLFVDGKLVESKKMVVAK